MALEKPGNSADFFLLLSGQPDIAPGLLRRDSRPPLSVTYRARYPLTYHASHSDPNGVSRLQILRQSTVSLSCIR